MESVGALAAAKQAAKRYFSVVLPDPVYDRVRLAYSGARGRWNRNDLLSNPDAIPSPLVTEVFDKIREWPGYFTYDDCVAFTLILGLQTALGVKGDVLEIGSYHGRSTAVLATKLVDRERLTVCDTFARDDDEQYPNPPTPATVWKNIRELNPHLERDRVEILTGRSEDLHFQEGVRFRFAHVDGGHSYDVALADLRLCGRHMLPGGVIAVDDYEHPAWREVTHAVDTFLGETPDFQILADVNRFAESGRKMYLIRQL